MMRLVNTAFLVFLFCANGISQTANNKWDLDKCVDYAIKNNISIKRADIQAKLAALQFRQAKLNKYPTVGLSSILGDQSGRSVNPITYTYTTIELLTHSYQLTGSLPIYSFGKTKNNVRSQGYDAQAARLNVDKTMNDVALNVIDYYLQIVVAYEEMHIRETQIAQTNKQLEITRSHLEAGTLPELNLVQLETQLVVDSSDLLTAKETYENNILVLKSILNIDEAVPFEVSQPALNQLDPTPLSNLQPEIVYNSALQNQPAQKSTILKSKAAYLNIKIAKAALYPNLYLGYNIATGFSNYISGQPFGKWWQGYGRQLSNNSNEQIAMTLSVPIFSNGHSRLVYDQANLNMKDIQLQQQQDNAQLKKDIYAAFSSAAIAYEKVDATKKIVTGSQKSFEILLGGYEAGGTKIIDLVTIQNALARAKIQYSIAQSDYIFKIKLLEFYKAEVLRQQK